MAESIAVLYSNSAGKHNTSTSVALYPLLASLVLSYWLSIGVSIGESLRISAVVALQIAFGSVIWQRVSGRRQNSACENIGMGFATGSLVLVAVRQTAIVSGGRPIELLLLSAVIAVLLPSVWRSWSILRDAQKTSLPRRRLSMRITQSDVIVTAAAGVAVLAAREHIGSFRILTTGVLILFAIFIARQPQVVAQETRRLWLSSAVIVTMVALPAMLQTAAPWHSWAIRLTETGSDDVIFSEAVAHIIDSRGPYLDVSQSTMFRYHWLSMAWTGTTGRLANIEPLTMSALLAPSIGYLIVTALIIAILQTSIKSKLLPIAGVVCLFLLSSPGLRLTTIFVESTSNIFGHVWLLATIACNLSAESRNSSFVLRQWTLVCVFTGATVLAKGPYGAVLVVVSGTLLMMKSLQERRLPSTGEIGNLVAATVGFIFVYFGLISSSWSSDQMVVGLRSLVEGIPSPHIGVLISILWILVRLLPVLVRLPQTAPPNGLRTISIAAIPAIGIDFWINSNGDTYFINGALAIVAVGIAVCLCDLERSIRLNRSIQTSWLEVLLTLIAVVNISHPILSQLPPNFVARPGLIFGIVVFCGLGAPLVLYSRLKLQHSLRPVMILGVVASVVLGAFGRVSQVGELPQRAEFPTSTELLVMNKIREATTTKDIVATNFGFCRETNCSRNDYRRLFLPALAHREPYPLVVSEVLTSEFPNQNSLLHVLAFSDNPTALEKRNLVSIGVTHFLFDTTGAEQSLIHQISTSGHLIFRVSNFILIELSSK